MRSRNLTGSPRFLLLTWRPLTRPKLLISTSTSAATVATTLHLECGNKYLRRSRSLLFGILQNSQIGSSHFGYEHFEQKVTCRGDFLRLATYALSAAFVDVELSSKAGTLSGATHLHLFDVLQAKWTSRGNAKPGSSSAVCCTREITVYFRRSGYAQNACGP